MTTDPRIHGLGAPQPARADQSTPAGQGGAAFRALLERLEDEARALRAEGGAPLSPEELAGAVDRARATLDDAFSLGDHLLEAYRAAVQSKDETPEGATDERRDS